ncbi:hypothetical protein QJS10_CPB17g01351 [Acorus calamus]|uniref:Uncharacterized protein n=1 Tax=Acorus calamus TaxID=4465 RepID=A0AAV9CTH3_ACOCL|nr:hypothetical protein QJS10_CPB17g01351 [Acorus calamus]
MQNWRSKLDTQVKPFGIPVSLKSTSQCRHKELSELKKTLNVEVEQLRTEFQELKSTLQKQQEEVTTGLKKLGINDTPEATETEASKAGDGDV